MTASLYERLGSTEGINRIANDIVDLHMANPAIAKRFASAAPDTLKKGAATFFITGTGGPACYEGKDMLETHRHMNISAIEFVAVLDDAINAMDKNNIPQREQEEVLFVLFSMRNEIIMQ